MTDPRELSPACVHCPGNGWHYLTDPNGIVSVTDCVCRQARKTQQCLTAARIPLKYRSCTFENFNAYHPQLERARQKVSQYADMFPNLVVDASAKLGLFLQGLPGTGKSHLAAAAVVTIIQRTRARAIFVDTRDLLRLIRHSFNETTRTTEYEVLRPVMDAELLVLDDLGAERPTEWVEETMNLIINTRYSEERRTIITTNYPDGPSDDPNTLECRIGFRMRSRVAEMCEFIELDGADYRQLPPSFTNKDLLGLMKGRSRTLPTSAGRPARVRWQEPVRDGKADVKWPGGRGGNH